MRWITALALALAPLAAAAHPVDAFLAAADGAELVIVVPRLARLTEPLAAALRQAREVPALAGFLGSAETLPFALLEADYQRKSGLDPQGSLLYAKLVAGPVVRLPVRDRPAVTELLATVGRTATPATVAGQDGWQTDEGVLAYHDGGLYGAPGDTLLVPFLSPAGVGVTAPLARCPRGPGEADLYLWARNGRERGCMTVRIDPDRLLVEVQSAESPLIDRWLVASAPTDPLLTHLGPDVTGLLMAHLAPAVLARLSGLAPPTGDGAPPALMALLRTLDGRIALGAGPALGAMTVALGVADPAATRAALSGALALPSPFDVVAEGADTWRLTPKKAIEIKGMPAQDLAAIQAGFVGLRGHELLLTTVRARLDAPTGRPELAPAGAVLAALVNRTGGRPHDGSALVDGLAPVLGSNAPTVAPWVRGAAWVAGHLGAWSVRLERIAEDRALRLRLEVEIL